MDIDYEAIGSRIRKKRIQRGLTQDKVAEVTELSNPHISNIERGTTKLSLPTIIAIANALCASVDELLCDNIEHSQVVFQNEIAELLEDCSGEEVRVIVEIVKATKTSLRKIYHTDNR